MEQVVEDLHTLVRCTREAGEPQWLDFRTTVREAADTISDDLTVTIENDGDIAADPTRLKQLWKNAIRFAVYNDATTVTVRLTDDGFAVSDDGKYTAAERTGLLFEYESAEPNAKAGMSLPNVRAIARVEGWTVEPDPTYTDGLSYRIGGVQVEQDDGDDLDVQ